MGKIIRLTEKQLKRLKEEAFDQGFDNANTIPEYPQSTVNVSGKVNSDEFANPVTTDDVANKMAKSFPWGVGAYYRGTSLPMVQEGEESSISDMYNNTDQTGDGVKDKFNHADANVLNDGNEDDDQQIIPHTIEIHLDRLIKAIQNANLPAKKQINILNKLVDNMNLQGIPPSYKKETSMKIFAKK